MTTLGRSNDQPQGGDPLNVSISQGADTLRLLIDNVQDYAIFLLDDTGHVMSWNTGARRINGYTAQEIIGKHFSIFYPEEDLAWDKPAYELRVAAEVGKFEDEGWRIRKDGTRFWSNVIITALYDETGSLRGFGKVTRDLTDRREVELAKERFIANAAHELRTPLSVIIGFATHLKNPDALKDPELPELIDALSRQAARLRTLVNNLLDMTQLGQGRMKLTLESVRLDGSVARVMQLLPAPEGKTVDVRVPEMNVRADAARLDQVITNLVSNAYRYGGNHIVIRARRSKDKHVIIDISDDGPGIGADLVYTLFEPFKRGAPHQRIEGSGLGLAISKGIIEAFGGTVEVLPNDPGAHFRITLNEGEAF